MPSSREDNNRESSNNNNAQGSAPSSSHFAAVNGVSRNSAELPPQPSTIRVSGTSQSGEETQIPSAPERDYNLVPDHRAQSANSPRIGTPPRTHSRSVSASGSAGEKEKDSSEIGSSTLQSPITLKSQHITHHGQKPKAHLASKQFVSDSTSVEQKAEQVALEEFANWQSSEKGSATAATVNKRKRTSQPPIPYPPHHQWTDQEMSSVPEVHNNINSNNPFSNNDFNTIPEFRRAGNHSGPDVARPLDGMERAPSSDGGASSERTGQSSKQDASNATHTQEQVKRRDSQGRRNNMVMTEAQHQQHQHLSTPQNQSQLPQQDQSHGFDANSTNITPSGGVRIVDNKRKRVFSHRTRTGCITCRRRKKKCDEGKPECKF